MGICLKCVPPHRKINNQPFANPQFARNLNLRGRMTFKPTNIIRNENYLKPFKNITNHVMMKFSDESSLRNLRPFLCWWRCTCVIPDFGTLPKFITAKFLFTAGIKISILQKTFINVTLWLWPSLWPFRGSASGLIFWSIRISLASPEGP